MLRRHWLGIVIASALSACARPAPPPGHVESAPLLPLIELVPPAPQPLVVAHPRVLLAAPAAEVLLRALVDAEHERAFVERTGVDPRTVDELVAREEGEGYLAIARGAFDAHAVVQRAGERLALPDVTTDTPRMRREGLAGQGRYAYAALDAHTVLVAKDTPPQLVAKVFALVDAQGKAGLPSALSTEPAHGLATSHAAAPFALYAPAPLALPQGSGLALLLAEQEALVATVQPESTLLRLEVELRGAFPPGADANFRTLGRSMSANELMHMLGLSPLLAELEVLQTEGALALRGSVPAQDVAAGLRALFFADARALFE